MSWGSLRIWDISLAKMIAFLSLLKFLFHSLAGVLLNLTHNSLSQGKKNKKGGKNRKKLLSALFNNVV